MAKTKLVTSTSNTVPQWNKIEFQFGITFTTQKDRDLGIAILKYNNNSYLLFSRNDHQIYFENAVDFFHAVGILKKFVKENLISIPNQTVDGNHIVW